ncbi:MAG: 2OG-Fe(II) oxygenase [Planctomycetes bacterium]|nr:2OG-Fe(II) oxygenase [Planctomycetota bacterium]
MALLRASVLRFPQADGGLELLDLLLDTLHALSPSEAAALAVLEAGQENESTEALRAKLKAALLLEGPVAEQLRRQRRAARVHRWAESGAADEPWEPPGAPLPELLARDWRDPERYRRLREERLAGREVFLLRGLLCPQAAAALREEALALPFERLETPHVQAERHVLSGKLAPLQALLRDPAFREGVGAVLGRSLGEDLVLNAWRMRPGDRMAVHPDGPSYLATITLGLCPSWRAAQGGAIAFGTPSEDGLEVRERFLPHLGDACLFAPHARSWHAVERVTEGERLSVTAWWV